MKSTIIIALSFIVTFVAITGAILIGIEKYENIFAFDFRPKQKAIVTPKKMDNLQTKVSDNPFKKIAEEIQDSLKQDSLKKKLTLDSLNKKNDVIEEIKPVTNPQSIVKNSKDTTSKKNNDVVEIQKPIVRDSSYNSWKKATVKLYESMDSKRVAKIIQTFSDNVARDLIYSMKKKKAAEILTNLSPETAWRLTKQER